MPSSHRRYADWTVERIRREAASIGPATAALCELILERRPHPEQGFRACLGIVRLVRPFGADRLEAAATRAIEIGTLTYGSVRSILDNKLDRQAAQRPPANGVPIPMPTNPAMRYALFLAKTGTFAHGSQLRPRPAQGEPVLPDQHADPMVKAERAPAPKKPARMGVRSLASRHRVN